MLDLLGYNSTESFNDKSMKSLHSYCFEDMGPNQGSPPDGLDTTEVREEKEEEERGDLSSYRGPGGDRGLREALDRLCGKPEIHAWPNRAHLPQLKYYALCHSRTLRPLLSQPKLINHCRFVQNKDCQC